MTLPSDHQRLKDQSILTLDQSLHHLLTLLLFAVVTQERAERPSRLLLNWQHLLQQQPKWKSPVCSPVCYLSDRVMFCCEVSWLGLACWRWWWGWWRCEGRSSDAAVLQTAVWPGSCNAAAASHAAANAENIQPSAPPTAKQTAAPGTNEEPQEPGENVDQPDGQENQD